MASKGIPSRKLSISGNLRLPGQSLREIAQRKFDDFVPYLMIVVAFWIVFLVESAQKLAGTSPGPGFWAFLSLVVTAYGGIKIFRLYPQMRNFRRGEQGERRVAEILDRIRRQGFSVFHDLPESGFNIDHIAVGPSGIYAIETKMRSGSGTIDYSNEDELVFDGRIKDGRALSQARGCARAVHLQLKQHLHRNFWVKPLVVFVGDWRVRRHAGDFGADVTAADQLENYFERQQPELTHKEIVLISLHLERTARS